MNLYLIEQNYNNNWDTFDSAVVVAKSLKAAVNISPSYEGDSAWAPVEYVTATYLGRAGSKMIEGDVVCASFNAG